MIFEQRLRRAYVKYEVSIPHWGLFDHPIKRNSAIKILRGDVLQISIGQYTRLSNPLGRVNVFDIGVLCCFFNLWDESKY